MDREKIGLDARACQLGQHRPARRLAVFEQAVRLLRLELALGWLWNVKAFQWTTGWIVLLSVGVMVYLLSLLLSACERLMKNRWMDALRRRRFCSLAECLSDFSLRDVLLAVRIAAFCSGRLFVRGVLLLSLPAMMTAAAVWRAYVGGVGRTVFCGGAAGLAAVWFAAVFFLLTAREPLLAAASLLIDADSFARRKSSLARLDDDCFQLTRFCFSWQTLPIGARFQARAIYAQSGREISRSAISS